MTEAVVTIKVVFDKEEVKLQLQPGEFQFMEFDCWLRNRFDISPTDKVSFKNKEGIGACALIRKYRQICTYSHFTPLTLRRMLTDEALLLCKQHAGGGEEVRKG